jgi:hypothetical protein
MSRPINIPLLVQYYISDMLTLSFNPKLNVHFLKETMIRKYQ